MTNRLLAVAACLLLYSCGKKEEAPAAAEREAATPVQVAKVTTGSIDRVIEADAVLWPIQQSSLMPKISAPVRQFYVNRGDHVKAGQLVATLENRDLVAAEHESTANLAQAQAGYRTVSQATVTEDLTKAQTDANSTKQALEAAQKVYDSRVDLLNQLGRAVGQPLDIKSGPLVILSSNFQEYAHNYPNPFSAGNVETKIAYFLDAPANVTLKIYDITGELVHEESIASGDPRAQAGPQETTWDGRNDKGEVVRNGVYVCMLNAGGKSAKFRIAVAK